MAVHDIVTKPVTTTAKGIVKGGAAGGTVGAVTTGGITAAVVGVIGTIATVGAFMALSGIPALIVGGGLAALTVGATLVTGGASAIGGGVAGGISGAIGGGVLGLAAGIFKGIKGFVAGIGEKISPGPTRDSRIVQQMQMRDAAMDTQIDRMQADIASRRRQIMAAQESVANPDAPSDKAAKVIASSEAKATATVSLS